MDNGKDNGYENPYNPYENNENDNNYHEDENLKKQNKKTSKKIISLVKFIKTSGLKIIASTALVTFIYKTCIDYATVIGYNKYIVVDYERKISYFNMLRYPYILFLIIYYKYKYFNKKTNIFALIGIILSLGLFVILPFRNNLSYDTEKAQVHHLLSTNVTKYSDIKEEVKISMNDFDYAKSINQVNSQTFSFVFMKNYDDEDTNDFLDSTGVEAYTLSQFKEIESNLKNAKTLTYLLYNGNVEPKKVTKEEFYQNIEKYKPYYDFSKNQNKELYQNPDAYHWYDKWFIKLIVK